MDRKSALEFVYQSEKEVLKEFERVDKISFINSLKVLDAFHNNKVNAECLNGTTGYGYKLISY